MAEILKSKLNLLASLTGKSTSEKEAKDKNQKTYLSIKYSNMYGYLYFREIDLVTGKYSKPFGFDADKGVRKATLIAFIEGMIAGLQHKNEQVGNSKTEITTNPIKEDLQPTLCRLFWKKMGFNTPFYGDWQSISELERLEEFKKRFNSKNSDLKYFIELK